MVLELYADASMRKFITPYGERNFGCAGAMCGTTGASEYKIIPDTTNNKAELIAIMLACIMANTITRLNPEYDEIDLYSDSQFSVFGLTKWINGWIKNTDSKGIMYGSNNQPVKNQELFAMILNYLVDNQLRIRFHHMAGHVRVTSHKMLSLANETFYKSNGYYLKPEDIYKISYYNDIVDTTSRNKLENINPNDYPILSPNNGVNMVNVVIHKNFRKYVQR